MRLPMIFAEAYASNGDIRMIITQIGIAISARSILFDKLLADERGKLAGTPATTALTNGPDTG
jgi:hypothetical protein